MQQFKIHRGETGIFDANHVRMVYDQYSLLPFLNRVFSSDNVLRLTEQRSSVDRNLLVNALKDQYEGIHVSSETKVNIEKLANKNAFTVTTGHQLSLFTGPMYVVVKILHVIKLAAELKKDNHDLDFVPVFWMASEDHDFQEISALNIFGKELKWNSEQTGPVGRFSLDEGFQEVRSKLKGFFEGSDEILELLDAYDGSNLAEANRKLINKLFGKYGLVIIDGDHAGLKQSFRTILKQEISSPFAHEAVEEMNSSLIREGLSPQAKTREINLFYIENGLRSRIERKGENFSIAGKGDYTLDELLSLVELEPEKFSPNVVLRPVYQETILPNVVYVGGVGEFAYWLQLKSVFEKANVDFPLIQVRNSVLWIDSATEKKIAKIELPIEQVFWSKDELKRWYLENNETEVLDDEALMNGLKVLKDEIIDYVLKADHSLAQYGAAEGAKIEKQIDSIRSKVIRMAKSRHETNLSAIDNIKDKLFPNNALQEREVNFFNFCPDGKVEERIGLLYNFLEPFEGDLFVIREC